MDPTRTGALSTLAERVAGVALLERPAAILTQSSERWTGSVAELMRGRPLGHPLHPALTDLPIGFWTSAVVLDLAGGRKRADAATRLVALGILSAAPTAVAGFADVPALDPAKRRVAVVHAVSNTAALFLFTRSWWDRIRGRRAGGIVAGLLGAAAATFGGYLGGWLAFGDPVTAASAAALPAGTQPISRLSAVR